jgi:hypothetical protein
MTGLRYANIGLAVSAVILVVGVVLFRDSGEEALQGVGLAAFVIGSAVYLSLEKRAERREKDRAQ